MNPRVVDYEDYLKCLSLNELRREAREFREGDKHDRRIGSLILKMIAEKLKKSTSNSTPISMHGYETQRYNDKNQDYSSRYTA